MSKKARKVILLKRRGLAIPKNLIPPIEIDNAFSDFLCYGMIIKRRNPDGSEERVYPITEYNTTKSQ